MKGPHIHRPISPVTTTKVINIRDSPIYETQKQFAPMQYSFPAEFVKLGIRQNLNKTNMIRAINL